MRSVFYLYEDFIGDLHASLRLRPVYQMDFRLSRLFVSFFSGVFAVIVLHPK